MDFENKPLKTSLEHVQSPEGSALEQKWEDQEAEPDPNAISPEEIADLEAYAVESAAKDRESLARLREHMGLPQVEEHEEYNVQHVELTKVVQERKIILDSLENGDLSRAEGWLIELKENIDPNELDHISDKLFNAYLENEDWSGAERMIALANGPLPMEGRRKKLQIDSGQEIKSQVEITYQEQSTEQLEQIEGTNDFRDAVLSGHLSQAEDWLLANKDKEKYDARWLDHRSGELFDAYRALGRLDDAEKMIAYSSDDNSREGRKRALEIDRGAEESTETTTEPTAQQETVVEQADEANPDGGVEQ